MSFNPFLSFFMGGGWDSDVVLVIRTKLNKGWLSRAIKHWVLIKESTEKKKL